MPRVNSLREAAQNEHTFLQLNELLRLSEAENAALKEQVAMVSNENSRNLHELKTIKELRGIQKLEETITTLQSKSAALVDALERMMEWQVKNVQRWENEPYDNAFAALAAFKGEK